ncbi:uncharacterized protein LOC129741037 [Uranotaenia lowii]|uniref:uncharacterized protein LOC129741037 n=1 Tax=Uranotaenia lowii TaxID=190385 RepID=UPI00247AD7D1|nr:uncharacterized protein LOC129741037 [Uranotaenia lowii]
MCRSAVVQMSRRYTGVENGDSRDGGALTKRSPSSLFNRSLVPFARDGFDRRHPVRRTNVGGSLPDTDPKITGGKPRYQINDMVRVNCTSGRSKPAAGLTWFINGEVADPAFLRRYDTVITGREGLETTILGLQFRVRMKHFRHGDMKLKCVATIAHVYWKSNEESVEGDKPIKPPALESKETLNPNGSRADRQESNTGSSNHRRRFMASGGTFLLLLGCSLLSLWGRLLAPLLNLLLGCSLTPTGTKTATAILAARPSSIRR